jgi:hypothetical protein
MIEIRITTKERFLPTNSFNLNNPERSTLPVEPISNNLCTLSSIYGKKNEFLKMIITYEINFLQSSMSGNLRQ